MQTNNIPDEVKEELNDPEYLHLTHYKRSTYEAGCRGPLCRKSERDRSRKKLEIDEARLRVDREYDALLDEIIEWYFELRKPKPIVFT